MILKITVGAFVLDDTVKASVEALSHDRLFLRSQIATFDGGIDAAISYLADHDTPNLLIVQSNATDTETLYGQLDQLSNVCQPGVRVMLIGAVNDISLFKALIDQGVAQYFVNTVTTEEIRDAAQAAFADDAVETKSRLISFMGLRGGVGSSVLAHNTAVELARQYDEDVIVVDLDLAFGTAALTYNIQPAQTIVDALSQSTRLDEMLIERFMEKVAPNVRVLAAPGSLSSGVELAQSSLELTLNLVRQMASYVILDLPHAWVSWAQELLIDSDEVVLVGNPDLYNLRDGKNMIEFLSPNRSIETPTRLVFNKCGQYKSSELPNKEFKNAFHVDVDLNIPYEPDVFGPALTNGDLLSEVDKKAKSVEAVSELARMISAREVVKSAKKGAKSGGLFQFLKT